MSDERPKTKIYVGTNIEHESERKFLAFVADWLDERNIPSVILANVEFGGRQIDCVVATDSFVAVVEVKTSFYPIRGGITGTWSRLSASGEWNTYGNAYQQALNAKMCLRDAMQSFKPLGSFYPDGYVVFTAPIPNGSDVTSGNYKTLVTTIDRFPDQIKMEGALPWTLADWHAFAQTHRLSSVSLDQAIANPKAQEEFDVLDRYIGAVAAEYARSGALWISETESARTELVEAASTGAGCFISGPSGCGKSIMAKWLTAKLAEEGHPTFFISAKNFSGSWADSLRREIGLLIDGATASLYRALDRCSKPTFLIVDGVNEFGASAPESLRGVRALARRMGALLVITSQDSKPDDFAGLRSVTVARPSLELKKQIARSVGGELTSVALDVLRAVGSGIEAGLVGQIGGDLKADATRLLLVNQYMRKRLAGRARAGSFGLRRLASWLFERVAFSIIETDFDELMHSEGLSFAECDALFEADLLVRRVGRVSFSHEMILNACAASDLARAAVNDAVGLGQKLSTPMLEPISADVIAAIDSADVCRDVLAEILNSSLLAEAVRGCFGPLAASTASDLLTKTAEFCVAEIREARLQLSKVGEVVQIGWDEMTLRKWSYPEKARLRAIGHLATYGIGLNTFLMLCAEMDARLTTETHKWAEFAREQKYAIRDQSFALTYYYGFGETVGLTEIVRSVRVEHRYEDNYAFPIRLENLSSGQLHFFLENRRMFSVGDESEFAKQLIYLFQERFRREPYHVQLVMLDSIGSARQASQELIEQLIAAIESVAMNTQNWGINSAFIDALKILGALDNEAEASRAQIKADLASVLVDDESVIDTELALSLYSRMFDHPFDTIYSEEIDELDEVSRRRLYRRALRAPSIKISMCFDLLMKQIVSFGDPEDASLLKPFTGLPSRTNPFPQGEWGAFVVATRFFGRHHAALEAIVATTPEERCLVAIRFLIYAIEAKRPVDLTEAKLVWQQLHKIPSQLVVGCLVEIKNYGASSIKLYPQLDLVAAYSADFLAVSRRFIDEGTSPQFFRGFGVWDGGLSLPFNTVAKYGDRSDIERLRCSSRDLRVASYALEALKCLELGPTID